MLSQQKAEPDNLNDIKVTAFSKRLMLKDMLIIVFNHVLQDEPLFDLCFFFKTSNVFRWSLSKCHAILSGARSHNY